MCTRSQRPRGHGRLDPRWGEERKDEEWKKKDKKAKEVVGGVVQPSVHKLRGSSIEG